MLKQFLQLLFLIFAVSLGNTLSAQTIFVDAAASGSNDGSDWSNAYTDLTDALANANTGDAIWVAAGTYLPGSGTADTLATFAIDAAISIYGGFAGTESTLEERDLASNVTVLSGDLAGDDPLDDYEINRDDNALHVMYIGNVLAEPVVLDGLTISGGYNNDAVTGVSDYFWRGAGLYANSTVEITNCTFTRNRSESGTAVYLNGTGTDGSVFDSSSFFENKATEQGVLFIAVADDVIVRDCTFEDNLCNRGALYPNSCNNTRVEGCTFSGNFNPTGFGGAVFSWQNYNLSFNDCAFNNNRSQNAGVMYIDARNDTDFDTERVKIENCTFTGNTTATGGGGALYFWMASYSLDNCTFIGNQAVTSAGAIGNFGESKAFRINNCEFTNNTANFGGAVTSYSEGTNGLIENSTFTENTANTSGGAHITGFKANVDFVNCVYDANSAGWGGAMYFQNDTTSTSILDCYFTGNNCENIGGAVNISGGIVSLIEGCVFEGNQAGTGGAIALSDSENNHAVATLNRLSFLLNAANGDQAGALNTSNVNLSLTNSLFVFNAANGLGTGGAISLNATDTSVVSIVNNTFVDNIGALSAGIAAWTGDTIGQLTITMQNNYMGNDGINYAIEGGTPLLVSGGGNYITDASANAFLTDPTDQLETITDPMFVDEGDFDYHLLADSPLINAGVASGAPATDLDGITRDANPDIGSYEFDFTNGIEDILDKDNQLSISPNPLQSQAKLVLENDWRGWLTITVFDAQGRSMQKAAIQKNNDSLHWDLDAANLVSGAYWLVVEQAGQQLARRLVKL